MREREREDTKPRRNKEEEAQLQNSKSTTGVIDLGLKFIVFKTKWQRSIYLTKAPEIFGETVGLPKNSWLPKATTKSSLQTIFSKFKF